MAYLLWLGLMACLGGGWLLTLFGFPGNWVMVVAAAIYWALPDVSERAPNGGWWIVGTIAVVAVLAEVLEALSGAASLRVGGSKRGAVLAVIGSFFGSMIGAVIGLPVPVLGSIVAIVLGACLGAMAGAAAGELWKGRGGEQVTGVATAAFWGRLYGTFAKLLAGAIIFATATIASFPVRSVPAP